MTETANELVLKCTVIARDGADFPTVWEAVLKRHALVVGPPIQTFDDEERLQLEIRLVNGQRLVYKSDSNEYCQLVPRCCVDRLRPPGKADVTRTCRHFRFFNAIDPSQTWRASCVHRLHG